MVSVHEWLDSNQFFIVELEAAAVDTLDELSDFDHEIPATKATIQPTYTMNGLVKVHACHNILLRLSV